MLAERESPSIVPAARGRSNLVRLPRKLVFTLSTIVRYNSPRARTLVGANVGARKFGGQSWRDDGSPSGSRRGPWTHSTIPGRHADGDGLYLTVRSGGSKQWIYLYRSGGRLREMGLGSPASEVTLAKARQLAADARGQTTNGQDPLAARQQAEQRAAQIPKFGDYALSLVDRIEVGFSNTKHRQQWRNTLTTYCQPIWTSAGRSGRHEGRPGLPDAHLDVQAGDCQPAARPDREGAEQRESRETACGRESGCMARPPRRYLATTQQSLARTSCCSFLSPSCPPSWTNFASETLSPPEP